VRFVLLSGALFNRLASHFFHWLLIFIHML
jgi:hypothetical protein